MQDTMEHVLSNVSLRELQMKACVCRRGKKLVIAHFQEFPNNSFFFHHKNKSELLKCAF